MSPVNSRTAMRNGARRSENLATTSWAKAFIGAMYTAFTAPMSSISSSVICCFTCCKNASMAMLVLPAPVGAHTSMFSEEL
jgi:hypothetical protein